MLASGASYAGRSGGQGVPARALQATSFADTAVPSVLVVEPDERARSLIGVALARAGFQTVAVASAEEALRQLSLDRPLPVMVVAEVGLPGLDGFALCSQLRAELRTAHLPILLLARSPEGFHRELATHAGADDYLAKPVFVHDVVSLVRLKSSPRALDGSFQLDAAALPVPELLRALLAGVRSGRIDLLGGRARLVFRQGRVVDAAFESLQGEDALVRILLLAEGGYQVGFGPSLERAAFSLGLRDYCARIFPRALKWRELVARSVPLSALLALDFARLAAQLSQLPDGINPVVRLFDGHRTVLKVILESPLEEVVTLEVITRLYALGILAPLEAESSPAADAFVARKAPPLFESAGRGEAAASPRPPEEMERLLFGDLEQAPAADESWQALPLPRVSEDMASAALPAVEAPLAPDVLRQLEAFRIRPVVEAPELKVAAPVPAPKELTAFTRGEPPPSDASLSASLEPSALADAPPVTPGLALVRNEQAAAPAALAGGEPALPAVERATPVPELALFSKGLSRVEPAVEAPDLTAPIFPRPSKGEEAKTPEALAQQKAALTEALRAVPPADARTEVEREKAALTEALRAAAERPGLKLGRLSAPTPIPLVEIVSARGAQPRTDSPSPRASEPVAEEPPKPAADAAARPEAPRSAAERIEAARAEDLRIEAARAAAELSRAGDVRLEAARVSALRAAATAALPAAAPAESNAAAPDAEQSFFAEDGRVFTAEPSAVPLPAAQPRWSLFARSAVAVAALGLISAAVAVTTLPENPFASKDEAPLPASAPAHEPLLMPEEAVAAEASAPEGAEAEPAVDEAEPAALPDAFKAALDEGIKLYDAGKTKESVKRLQQVVEADPTSATAWLFLGLARFDASDSTGAQEAANKALALDPKNGRAVMLLASVYLDTGHRPQAEVELRRYLQLEPNGQYAEEAKQLLSSR